MSGGDDGMKASREMFVKLGGECELNVTIDGDPMLNLCHKTIPERFPERMEIQHCATEEAGAYGYRTTEQSVSSHNWETSSSSNNIFRHFVAE